MAFEQPEERAQTKINLNMRSWWLGRRIVLEMTGPSTIVREFIQNYIPLKINKEKSE